MPARVGYGGFAMVASGVLFFALAILDFAIGPPPSVATDVLAWRDANATGLAWVSETCFFAAILLVPATLAWYRDVAPGARFGADIAAGITGIAIALLVALLVVHGRLIYPIFGMRAETPQLAATIVMLYYGGMHAVYLLMAVAAVAASLAMRRVGYPKWVANGGFVVAATDVAGSYPWAIGARLTFVCDTLFAAWFIAVGLALAKRTSERSSSWSTA